MKMRTSCLSANDMAYNDKMTGYQAAITSQERKKEKPAGVLVPVM